MRSLRGSLAVVLVVVAISMLGAPVPASAQTPSPRPVALEPVVQSGYGVSSVMPVGWTPISPGVRGRGRSPGDPTFLAIQSAAATREQLWPSLLPQFGLSTRPEPFGTRVTDSGQAWTLYRIPIAAQHIMADLALSEQGGRTNLVLLVSQTDESETLRGGVFMPAVDAFRVVGADASPVAPDQPAGYTDVDVAFPGGAPEVTLAGTLSVPDGPGPFAAIVLLSGSGPQDRDESVVPVAAIKPFALVADALARAGIAVLRYDDRGTAASTGDFGSAVIDDFTADGAAALAFLRLRPEIDPTRVGVLGHSEGGIEVARLGARDPGIAFIVGLAAPVADGTDVLVAQSEAIVRTAGLGEVETKAAGTYARAVYAAALAGDRDRVEAVMRDYFGALYDRQAADHSVALGQRADFIDGQVAAQLPIITSPWFVSLLGASPAADWRRVTVPVLAIYGGKDIQVLAEQQVAVLRPALAAAGNDHLTIVTLPDANHLFQSAVTGAMGEYGSLAQEFTPDFLPTLVDWILQVAGTPEGASPTP